MKSSKELNIAMIAAKKAGEIVMRGYGKADFVLKADNSFVSRIDMESEKAIKDILLRNFPGHGFIGEESGAGDSTKKAAKNWIVDPLDGTTNYKMRNPFFNISICLSENSRPIVGVVYNPYTKEMFYGQDGQGAYLNGKKIRVSENADAKRSIIAFCHGVDMDSIDHILKIYRRMKKSYPHVRQFGAAALELAYVSAGRVDGYLMTGVNSWDVAAGTLLVREAGGIVTDFFDIDYEVGSDTILASNGKMHSRLLKDIGRRRQHKA